MRTYGDSYWQAKRRYGQNVGLTWIGSTPVKTTDANLEATSRCTHGCREAAAGAVGRVS